MLHVYALFSSSFSHRCLSCTCDGIVVVRIRNCARILFSRHFCAACGPVCTCMLIGIRRGFGGGRRYIRRGLGVAPMPTRRGSLWTGCFLFAWQPDKPFAKKATVCCIGFFLIVRRCRQLLLLVFSILLSCLLLLCTQRTSSNLFVVVMHSSSVRSTLSARRPLFSCCFVKALFACFLCKKKLSFVMVPLSGYFVYFGVFVLYTGCNFRRW